MFHYGPLLLGTPTPMPEVEGTRPLLLFPPPTVDPPIVPPVDCASHVLYCELVGKVPVVLLVLDKQANNDFRPEMPQMLIRINSNY
jgi:hypothetical protein